VDATMRRGQGDFSPMRRVSLSPDLSGTAGFHSERSVRMDSWRMGTYLRADVGIENVHHRGAGEFSPRRSSFSEESRSRSMTPCRRHQHLMDCSHSQVSDIDATFRRIPGSPVADPRGPSVGSIALPQRKNDGPVGPHNLLVSERAPSASTFRARRPCQIPFRARRTCTDNEAVGHDDEATAEISSETMAEAKRLCNFQVEDQLRRLRRGPWSSYVSAKLAMVNMGQRPNQLTVEWSMEASRKKNQRRIEAQLDGIRTEKLHVRPSERSTSHRASSRSKSGRRLPGDILADLRTPRQGHRSISTARTDKGMKLPLRQGRKSSGGTPEIQLSARSARTASEPGAEPTPVASPARSRRGSEFGRVAETPCTPLSRSEPDSEPLCVFHMTPASPTASHGVQYPEPLSEPSPASPTASPLSPRREFEAAAVKLMGESWEDMLTATKSSGITSGESRITYHQPTSGKSKKAPSIEALNEPMRPCTQ